MCFYCKAASTVLDTLWVDADLRDYFRDFGIDLTVLGPLTHEVFVPAYRAVKDQLDLEAMTMLEAQVTEDLLAPYYDRPGFRQVWVEWDQNTRADFIREQSELQLATLLLRFYADAFAEAYKAAYKTYRDQH